MTKDKLYSMRLSEGFAVVVPHLILDEDEGTIVAMQTIGPEQAINANWAAIVNGGAQNYINDVLIKLKGMKSHFRLKGTLPCGWTENWLIHEQASITQMNTGDAVFYVLDEDEGEEVLLDRFFKMLDLSLPIPMLPEWKYTLWYQGQDYDLIKCLDTSHAINLAAWKVKRDVETWQIAISHALDTREVTF